MLCLARCTEFSDGGIDAVASLTNLRIINLQGCAPISAISLKALEPLRSLENLAIDYDPSHMLEIEMLQKRSVKVTYD